MINKATLQKLLGINGEIKLSADEMVKELRVTVFPSQDKASEGVKNFFSVFSSSLDRLGVQFVPFDTVWEGTPLFKRFSRFFKYLANNFIWIYRKSFGLSENRFYIPLNTIINLCGKKKIKKGVCVICVGEQETDALPMQFISSFKTNSVITILDFPEGINDSSNFTSHFDTAMSLFARHMTNIVLAVDDVKWMVYNFNASHPIYKIEDKEFDQHVLNAIIPKVVAPISPHRLNEFIIEKKRFDPNQPIEKWAIDDMREGARLFEGTGLYPKGKKISDLPFRHEFHKLIGSLHLDSRSGMSFGFIAFQLPVTLPKAVSLNEFQNNTPDAFKSSDYYIDDVGKQYILMAVSGKQIVLKMPDVWVMTLRSGSNKTDFDASKDLLKLGLKDGRMYIEVPEQLELDRNYKPSFDSKLILAHALGNAIVAEICEYLQIEDNYVKMIKQNGISISHWHGYFNRGLLPKGTLMYGSENPHVSCSSPQSAVYALSGKINAFSKKITEGVSSEYLGDIHIEPHHGINITYPRLTSLARYILDNPTATELGNKYL